MKEVRRYLIVCKKRSDEDELFYWRPMRRGYTRDLKKAGYYKGKDLDKCAGNKHDWYAMPVWMEVEE